MKNLFLKVIRLTISKINSTLSLLSRLSKQNYFKEYSPFFRVFICLYLIKNMISTWKFKSLLFKGDSFFSTFETPFLELIGIPKELVVGNFELFYLIYFVLIVLFFFGIGKRVTALLLFIFVEIVQNFMWITLNGGDNLLKFLIFYFIFIDSYDYYSIQKIKKTNFNNLLSNLGGFSILIHFCLIYFLSAIHKINADVWFNGIATYYILGHERFLGTSLNIFLVKNGFFVTISTYGTLFIELLFPFLVWNQKLKFFLLISSFFLHLSIAIFMMLYDFQILFILTLGFFITNSEWLKIREFINKRVNVLFT